MFKVGELVTGTANNGYYYTDAYSLCIVTQIENNDLIYVAVLKMAEKSCARIVYDSFPIDNKTDGVYLVDASKFKATTINEYYTTMVLNGIETSDINTCTGFDEAIDFYNIKESEVKIMERTAIMNPVGDYEFNNENKKFVIDAWKNLYSEFNHNWTNRGLEISWDEFKRNDSGLGAFLSRHSKWNPDKMAIVFKAPFYRNRDEDVVSDFCYWLYDQLEKYVKNNEIKINC